MRELWSKLSAQIAGADFAQARLLETVITVAGVVLIRWLVVYVAHRQVETPRSRYLWRKASTYVAVVVGTMLVGRIWFQGFQDLATFLGLIGAGVAVALKDWVTNFFGWIFIMVRRPFTIGDRVQIGTDAGDVIDVRVFSFSLLEIGNWVAADQSTGRVIHIPNGKLMTEPMANYSSGFPYVWHEIPVVVTFESDWQAAKAILREVAASQSGDLVNEAARRIREASKKWLIYYTNLTPIVYTRVVDIGVQLTIRYLSEPRRRRGTEEAIWEAVLERFSARDDIDFAYPTRRIYNNVLEGKPGARAEAPPGTRVAAGGYGTVVGSGDDSTEEG